MYICIVETERAFERTIYKLYIYIDEKRERENFVAQAVGCTVLRTVDNMFHHSRGKIRYLRNGNTYLLVAHTKELSLDPSFIINLSAFAKMLFSIKL